MSKVFKYCLALIVALVLAAPAIVPSSTVYAQEPTPTEADLVEESKCVEEGRGKCITCRETANITADCKTKTAAGDCTDQTCDVVGKYLNPFINALTILFGVAVVIGIMIGGLQYASSGGDPQKSSTAKNHIRNAIVALIAYFFIYAFLQFIIPGKGLLGV